MKKIVFFSMLIIGLSSFSQTTINTVLKDFSILKVYNGIEVELVKSEEQRIEISGKKADKVKLKEDDGTLKISLRFPETMAEGDVIATLYYNKALPVIDANEGATITAKEIEQTELTVKSQEGAFVNLVVNTKFLNVKASSGGVIKLSGTTKNQDIDVDLGSTYHGFNLVASDVSLVKAGSGAKAEIKAGETLDAKVTFGGTILYKGQPEVLKEKKVIGGSIESRN